MVVPQVDNVSGGTDACRDIEERAHGIHPTDTRLNKSVLVLQFAVARTGQRTDVAELHRVANDDTALRAVQQWQRRSDVALARLIDHDKVEVTGFHRDPAASRERS